MSAGYCDGFWVEDVVVVSVNESFSECWKYLVVITLMYRCAALASFQNECDNLEVKRNEMEDVFWM